MINLKNLIELFESQVSERNFYCRTFDIKGEEWELHKVYLNSNNNKKCWKVKKLYNKDWSWFTSEELVQFVMINNLAYTHIEAELISIIKSIIVHNNLFNEDAKKIFGDDIIQKSMEEYHEFSRVLLKCLEEHIGKEEIKKKPILRLVHSKKD